MARSWYVKKSSSPDKTRLMMISISARSSKAGSKKSFEVDKRHRRDKKPTSLGASAEGPFRLESGQPALHLPCWPCPNRCWPASSGIESNCGRRSRPAGPDRVAGKGAGAGIETKLSPCAVAAPGSWMLGDDTLYQPKERQNSRLRAKAGRRRVNGHDPLRASPLVDASQGSRTAQGFR